jgi:hypothetical protein
MDTSGNGNACHWNLDEHKGADGKVTRQDKRIHINADNRIAQSRANLVANNFFSTLFYISAFLRILRG